MTFRVKLGEARNRVEADLAVRLDALVEAPERLRAAMRHALLGGGKRFRPFLVFESCRLFDVAPRAAATVAAALEAIHCYSLVHDDLPAMDNDAVRRGQPTVWTAFDEWTAILAGDALLTIAFEWLAAADSGIDARALGPVVAELAKSAGPAGMAGGQALDLAAGKGAGSTDLTVAAVEHLQALKTGALIRFACRAGPLLAMRPHGDQRALSGYGEALGLAFQISDDLLDAAGDAAVAGKAVGKDAASGKATLVGLLGLEGARGALARAQAAAVAALAPYGDAAEGLRQAAIFMGERDA